MRRKCYFGCTVDGPLHRFPKWEYPYEEKFKSWKDALSSTAQGYSNKYIYNNIRFCYRHFEKYFQSPSHKLTGNAVPTLLLNKSDSTDKSKSTDRPKSKDRRKSTDGPESTDRPESTDIPDSIDITESMDITEGTDGENVCQTSISILGSTELLALCRTCLNQEASNPIITEEIDYSEIVYIVTGIRVKMDDGLPQNLCQNCVNNIKNCLDFRKQCEKSETQLLKMKNIFENCGESDEKKGWETITDDGLDSDKEPFIIEDAEKNKKKTVKEKKNGKVKLKSSLRQPVSKSDKRQVCEGSNDGGSYDECIGSVQRTAPLPTPTLTRRSRASNTRAAHRPARPASTESRTSAESSGSSCDLCPASFRAKGGVRRHLRACRGAHGVACPACARTFRTAHALHVHAHVAHERPPDGVDAK